jgi:hypothetical protein
MKLNPPGSSSDLESARELARKLSSAAYGKRAGRRWDGKRLSAHVDTDDAPLSEVARATSASLRAPRAPEVERPATPEPTPSAEALAPHAEPPLAEDAAPPPAEEAAPPAPEHPIEARHDAPHAPRAGKSRVDALLEQALGRTATAHRAEAVVHEPFVPLPVAEPEPPAAEEVAAGTAPPEEPAAADSPFDEPPSPFDAEEPPPPASMYEPDAPVADVASEPSPFDAEPAADSDASPFDAEPAAASDASPFDAEPAAASDASPFDAEPAAAPEPSPFDAEPAAASATSPFDEPAAGTDEPPIGEPFDAEPPPADASPFDPDDLVGEPPAVEEPPPPPALPEWPEVLAQCLKIATTAKGALVAGRDGHLVAGTGQWPAKPDVIAGKLVPLIQKAGRSATQEPLAIKLGPNTLSSWQFEEEGELLTAAFISDAPLPAGVWPGLKVLLRRQ